jgi:L-aspartate oxidase
VDVTVIGAGAAGLYTALVAAEQGASVCLVSRSPLAQSASYWAQGGLAAALTPDDSVELHLEDTLRAGRDAVRRSAATVLCAEAPARVEELEQRGIHFDRSAEGRLKLSLEGGHSRRRVVHAGGSATGRHVTAALSAIVGAHERIEVRERSSALGLWVHEGRCIGALTDAGALMSRATVLATGGAAALWARTTNPRGAIGAGMMLAHDAGAALADMEFVQFHPTALRVEGEMDGFLVTEAVRGEGGLLVDAGGDRFVDELAPRDEVARAIHAQLAGGSGSVRLDMRSIDPGRFPNITEALARAGLDPTRDLIPVAPASHYMIGGVMTDAEGRSTRPGLFAVGEVSCTGVHGANRLASNSLSECFVYGRRVALAAVDEPAPPAGDVQAPDPSGVTPPSDETRAALWRDAGLVREPQALQRLLADPHPLARLIARSALAREETRGAHVRADRPERDPGLDQRHHVVTGEGDPTPETWH